MARTCDFCQKYEDSECCYWDLHGDLDSFAVAGSGQSNVCGG
jgi:hypothetical protein